MSSSAEAKQSTRGSSACIHCEAAKLAPRDRPIIHIPISQRHTQGHSGAVDTRRQCRRSRQVSDGACSDANVRATIQWHCSTAADCEDRSSALITAVLCYQDTKNLSPFVLTSVLLHGYRTAAVWSRIAASICFRLSGGPGRFVS